MCTRYHVHVLRSTPSTTLPPDRGENRTKTWIYFFWLMKVSDRDRNVKVKQHFGWVIRICNRISRPTTADKGFADNLIMQQLILLYCNFPCDLIFHIILVYFNYFHHCVIEKRFIKIDKVENIKCMYFNSDLFGFIFVSNCQLVNEQLTITNIAVIIIIVIICLFELCQYINWPEIFVAMAAPRDGRTACLLWRQMGRV